MVWLTAPTELDGGSTARRAVVERALVEVHAAIARHGGGAETSVTNEVIGVFGISRAREDDAVRAVRAAVEIGERLSAVAKEAGVSMGARTGVDTGRVSLGGCRALPLVTRWTLPRAWRCWRTRVRS